VASSDITSISAYMRVSWAYAVRNGLTAHMAAQKSPARRPKRLQPAHRPPGIASSETATESACVSAGPSPKTSIQLDRSM
jgi:hypothetical protein